MAPLLGVDDRRALEVEESLMEDSSRLVFPRYRDFCITNIVPTIKKYLGTKLGNARLLPDRLVGEHFDGVDRFLVIVVDSLGYTMSRSPRLEELTLKLPGAGSIVFPVTSTFPSTTTTALTSINTGLTPKEHGIIGYTMYLKDLGLVANMVGFTPAASEEREGLYRMGLQPEDLFRHLNFHRWLVRRRYSAYSITRNAYRNSALTRMLQSGAQIDGYVNAPDLCIKVRRLLEQTEGEKACIFAYWDLVDVASHTYGPESEEAYAELQSFFHTLNTELFSRLSRKASKHLALLMVGDHGHVELAADKRLRVEEHPELYSNLRIPPTGDSRAIFLHIRQGRIEEVRRYLDRRFPGVFNMWESDEAIRMGLFGGGRQHEQLLDRIGDLVAVPVKGYGLSYTFNRRRRSSGLRGVHGGLDVDEMLVPLVVARLG